MLIAAAAAAAVTVFMFTTLNVYAAQDLQLDRTEVDMDTEIGQYSGMATVLAKEGCTEIITSADPADPSIVSTEISVPGDEIFLYAVNAGETTVNVQGSQGTVIPVHVKIGDAAIQVALKNWSHIGDNYYGSPKLIVDTMPGAKVSVKVGKDKYKAITMPVESDAFVRKSMKLKKIYKLGTKVTATFTKGSAKVIKTYKIRRGTRTWGASAKGKKLKVQIWNAHKGDTIRLTIAKKTYTKKVTKNYNDKHHKFTFNTKSKIKKSAVFKITIKNKYKQKLESIQRKLHNGTWNLEDDWED